MDNKNESKLSFQKEIFKNEKRNFNTIKEYMPTFFIDKSNQSIESESENINFPKKNYNIPYQIYLNSNPIQKPIKIDSIKPRILVIIKKFFNKLRNSAKLRPIKLVHHNCIKIINDLSHNSNSFKEMKKFDKNHKVLVKNIIFF